MPLHLTQFGRFTFILTLCISIVLSSSVWPTTAFSQTPSSTAKEPEVQVTQGGWYAVGGVIGFGVAATAATFAINAIREPEPGIDCNQTPEACEMDTWDFIWTMSILAAAAGVIGLSAWGMGSLAEYKSFSQSWGWGLAGTFSGLPTGALLGSSIPEYAPRWGYFTMVSAITAATMAATGVYLEWVASQRGYAWPEFAIGILGAISGTTIGTLICGNRPCQATFIVGAVGGLIGTFLTTLAWGLKEVEEEDIKQQRNQLHQHAEQKIAPNLNLQWGMKF